MSRLARSCEDWHQLPEVCARVGTLLADQDGVYDPRDGNDRLLRGRTGIMSEAELVTLRNRRLRGRWHEAERGERFADPPIGDVETPAGDAALDPDEQVRAVVRLIFDVFRARGTAYAALRHLRGTGIRVGARERSGPRRGQLAWVPPTYSTVRSIRHHPFDAGAYAYGRRGPALGSRGGRPVRLAMGYRKVLIRDRVPAYLTRDPVRANRARLDANDARGDRGGPPRPGPGRLTGLVACGSCGWRRHTTQRQTNRPYDIGVRHHTTGEPKTGRGLPAGCVDRLVAELVLKAVEPAAPAAGVHACETVDRDRGQVLRVRRPAVDRSRYEADRAGRPFHAVEPENRPVGAYKPREGYAAMTERVAATGPDGRADRVPVERRRGPAAGARRAVYPGRRADGPLPVGGCRWPRPWSAAWERPNGGGRT
jgi:hypothetical protein